MWHRVELIQRDVVSGNQQALRLHESRDFMEYEIEENALRHDGRHYDEILMAKGLVGSS